MKTEKQKFDAIRRASRYESEVRSMTWSINSIARELSDLRAERRAVQVKLDRARKFLENCGIK